MKPPTTIDADAFNQDLTTLFSQGFVDQLPMGLGNLLVKIYFLTGLKPSEVVLSSLKALNIGDTPRSDAVRPTATAGQAQRVGPIHQHARARTMSVITLDAETFYRSKKDRTTPGPRYSLSGSTGKTYEMYIRDPEFKVHGVGVQIDRARPIWISENIGERLAEIFTPDNDHTVICPQRGV